MTETPGPRPIRGDSLRLEEGLDPPAAGTAITLQTRAHLGEVSSGM